MIKIDRYIINNNFIIGKINNLGEKKVNIFTLELPYKNNQNNISSIPEGKYIGKYFKSYTFGECVKVENNGLDACIEYDDNHNVKNIRKYIRIHAGNSVRYFKDKKGNCWRCDSRGCILVGLSCDEEQGLVFNSKQALKILSDYFKYNKQDEIIITNNFNICKKI